MVNSGIMLSGQCGCNERRDAGSNSQAKPTMGDLNDIEPKWRTLVVASVALAYPVGQTGFELGAYGELLFDNKLAAWITVTATLIVLVALPKKILPVPRAYLWFLAIPSLWVLGRFVIGVSNPGVLVHPVLFAAGAVSFALCVPYAIYLIVRIANPGLADLRDTRLRLSLAVIAVIFFGAGYGIGTRSELFLTCQELRVSGAELPEHCERGGRTAGSQSARAHSR